MPSFTFTVSLSTTSNAIICPQSTEGGERERRERREREEREKREREKL